MTKLDVVTGFLGAGKTTLLQIYHRWLTGKGVTSCIIENEFGTAGVDGAVLRGSGAAVRDISGGCVCCTLKVTLRELLWELAGQVERVILEPSGLFCGDDLLDIFRSPGCPVEPGMWCGIIDPAMLPLMNGEDRAVLDSEIVHAGSLLLSKTQYISALERRRAAEEVRRMLEPAPLLYTAPWTELEPDLWFPALQRAGTVIRPHTRRRFDHTNMFQSTSFAARRVPSEAALRRSLQALLRGEAGQILRIKGTVRTEGALWQVNGTPDALSVQPAADGPEGLNIIGRGLDRRRIRQLLP